MPVENGSHLRYAGFWRRLAAGLLELIVVGSPMFAAHYYGWHYSKELFVFMNTGIPICLMILDLYLLVKYGGTVGKLLVGIRVVRVNGEKISLVNAILRKSIDMLWLMLHISAFIVMLKDLNYELFSSLHGRAFADYWRSVYPTWMSTADDIDSAYIVSEAFVMLTNKKRRAIHDFIAGTVVIVLKKKDGAVQQPLEADGSPISR